MLVHANHGMSRLLIQQRISRCSAGRDSIEMNENMAGRFIRVELVGVRLSGTCKENARE